MSTELGVCEVPNKHNDWEEPLPTKLSWQAAAAINIVHVRMDCNPDRRRYFEPAFRLARDGGMRITANVTFDDLEGASPDAIEAFAFDTVQHYGRELEAMSFGNEFGGLRGMSPQAPVLDISQGGTFDFVKEVIGPRVLAFMRGARRASLFIRFELFDSDSTDVQQRCQELLTGTEFENDPNIYWTAHNYADAAGDSSKGDPAGQDYSSMGGMNGKPGFLSVFEDPLFAVTVEVPPPPPGGDPSGGFTNIKQPRGWLISEISKATGPFGGIAMPSDMDVMLRYTRMMLSTYKQCRRINFLTAKYFFTRTMVRLQPWLDPVSCTTWTQDEPVPSAQGLQIAAEFAKINGVIIPNTKMPGRRKRVVRP